MIHRLLCESPACPFGRRLSGLCEIHYWKREAERVHAELDAATTRGRELIIEAELAAHSAEVERDAANALVILLRDVVAASLYGSAQEKANAYLALARHDAATRRTVSKL